MNYIVQATITVTENKVWSTTKQIPTFILPGNILGIVSREHAIAVAMLLLTIVNSNGVYHINAEEVQ